MHPQNSYQDLAGAATSITSIHRLSEDDLVIIFSILRDCVSTDTPKFPFRKYIPRQTWDLSTLTQVCRYWLQTALGYPSLWSRLPAHLFAYPEKMRAFLERSKSTELTVAANIPYGPRVTVEETDSLIAVLQHLNRIRDFSLRTNYTVKQTSAWNEIHSLLSGPAPRLQALDLSANSYSHDTDVSFIGFPETSPLLSHLGLAHFSIPRGLTLHSVTGLIKLKLQYVKGLAPLTFLSLLKASPDLELLQVEKVRWDLTVDALNNSSSDALESREGTTVWLPKLSFLKFGFDEQSIHGFDEIFKCLDIPSKTTWICSCAAEWKEAFLDMSFYKRFAQPTVDESLVREDVYIRMMEHSLIMRIKRTFRVSEGLFQTNASNTSPDSNTSSLYIDWRSSTSGNHLHEHIDAMMSTKHRKTVKSVHFDFSLYPHQVGKDSWTASLQKFSSVESIVVQGHDRSYKDFETFLESLKSAIPISNLFQKGSSIVCPRCSELKSLTLEFPARAPNIEIPGYIIHDLEIGLQSRKQMGLTLGSLVIRIPRHISNLRESDKRALAQLVDHLHVDFVEERRLR